MEQLVQGHTLSEYEAIIKQIKDVVSARIVANEAGEIIEVHVLAKQNRGPKQLVRDIESAVMAQFGLAIDHKKISVAQLALESQENNITEIRPRLESAKLSVQGVSAHAKVVLRLGTGEFIGQASGPSTNSNRMRLIVQATLSALEQYLHGNCSFAVDDVLVSHMARHQVAVVALSLVTLEGEESLIGSAFVREDENESIVKATLNAVNRRVSLLIKE